MSTQSKNGSNGTTNAKPETNGKHTAATVVNLVPTKEDKKDEKLPEPSVKGIEVKDDLPPLEDRILKVQQLSDLVEKHDTLLETQKKINSFKLSSDGSRDTLLIKDSKGKEFITSNSSVIAEVIETVKASVAKKISDVERQIKF